MTTRQVNFRIPDELLQRVAESANANNRSTTAEIVARLEASGMTLRDYLAAQAMAAFVKIIITTKRETVSAAAASEGRSGDTFDQYIAFRAYEVADAMLAERAK